jgi:hypothetical protein
MFVYNDYTTWAHIQNRIDDEQYKHAKCNETQTSEVDQSTLVPDIAVSVLVIGIRVV